MSVKNPSKGGEIAMREPKDILEEMKKLDVESAATLQSIYKLL